MRSAKRTNSSENSDDDTLEGTLALIKPDAVHKAKEILQRIHDEGFLVVEKQRMNFSRSSAEKFYEEHRHKHFFEDLIDYITSGEVIALCLARKNGVAHWRKVIGPSRVSAAVRNYPDSLRAIYGDPYNDSINAVHGSDSPEASEREIEIVFPHILHGEAHKEIDRNVDMLNSSGHSSGGHSIEENTEYLKRYVCPTLLRGLSEMYETRPQEPIAWLSDWLSENNPYKQ